MPITLDGVALQNASAPVLFQQCRFPIGDVRRYRMPDEVVQNFPSFIGSWAPGTLQPVVKSQVLNIDTVTNIADACRFPIISLALTTCGWIAPDQKLLGLETESINWAQLITDYCTVANISDPAKLGTVFNADGTLNAGNPYALNIVRTYIATLAEGLGLSLTHSTILGDASNVNQFDGFYPQIDYGWEESDDACDNTLNVGNVVNWDLMTGGPGTGTASPDAVTDGATVVLWGQTFAVPDGWNMGDFLAYYSDAAGANFGRGKPIDWEMHAPNGWRLAVMKALSCITMCNLAAYPPTDALIKRYADLIAGKVVELFGYGLTFPVMETYQVASNTLRFGPRNIGGLPTYGLVFKNIVEVLRMLDPLGQALYGAGNGAIPGAAAEPLLGMTRTKIANRFESLTTHWDFFKITALCIRASMMLSAGVLATDRHLWLKITHVGATTFRMNGANDFTIDGVVVDDQPPAAPALTTPANNASATDTTPTYTWAAVAGAIDYTIEVSAHTSDDNGNFAPADIEYTHTGTAATATPTTPLALADHFWHVKARDVNGYSDWSVTRKNTITA